MLRPRLASNLASMRAALVLFACLGAAGAALAAPPPGDPPTDVSPVTVTPRTEPPKLVASYPAAGEAVAPGLLVLKFTFDQAMLRSRFDIAPAPGAEAPECLEAPRLLDDGKSFALLCRTRPGKAYALAFNRGATGGFANSGETRAQPANLAFTTTAGEPVRALKDALKAAGLREIDIPVQESPEVRGGRAAN